MSLKSKNRKRWRGSKADKRPYTVQFLFTRDGESGGPYGITYQSPRGVTSKAGFCKHGISYDDAVKVCYLRFLRWASDQYPVTLTGIVLRRRWNSPGMVHHWGPEKCPPYKEIKYSPIDFRPIPE